MEQLNKTHRRTMIQEVVLVNEQDEAIGQMEKMAAHLQPHLFNSKGEMLLQQRAAHKYHSGYLWTNACCGHPSPSDKDIKLAAKKRLNEEMGMTARLWFGFSFLYQASVGNGLTEHEFDHVFFAISNVEPKLNPSEVADVRYVSFEKLRAEIAQNPSHFTEWFKLIAERAYLFFQENRKTF
jgi:isopentenyl-diphosphate delta-isomerase